MASLKDGIKKWLPVIADAGRAWRALNAAISARRGERRVRRRAVGLASGSEPLRLELGAGEKRGENGWVTLDLSEGCDLRWDLRLALPFPNDRIEKIYSSHFLEHLTFHEGQALLGECLRVLRPGGCFSIAVPNARMYIEAYLGARALNPDEYLKHRPSWNRTTRIDFVNYIAYLNGGHMFMFDEENLLYVLAASGFRNARLRGFDASLDRSDRDYESIYAEADK